MKDDNNTNFLELLFKLGPCPNKKDIIQYSSLPKEESKNALPTPTESKKSLESALYQEIPDILDETYIKEQEALDAFTFLSSAYETNLNK